MILFIFDTVIRYHALLMLVIAFGFVPIFKFDFFSLKNQISTGKLQIARRSTHVSRFIVEYDDKYIVSRKYSSPGSDMQTQSGN